MVETFTAWDCPRLAAPVSLRGARGEELTFRFKNFSSGTGTSVPVLQRFRPSAGPHGTQRVKSTLKDRSGMGTVGFRVGNNLEPVREAWPLRVRAPRQLPFGAILPDVLRLRSRRAMARAPSAWHNPFVPNVGFPREDDHGRPILPWRFVGGAFLHCVVPVYLVAAVVVVLLTAPSGATLEVLLRHALRFSGWFLTGYGLLALLGISMAAALDPLLRARQAKRTARDPQTDIRRSEKRVRDAVAAGRGLFGPRADVHLAAIQSLRWDHADRRFQSLSVDLEDVVAAASVAKAAAPADRVVVIMATTSTTLGRIEAALGDLVAERARRAEGDVEAVARYVEMRYGPSDFSGRPD